MVFITFFITIIPENGMNNLVKIFSFAYFLSIISCQLENDSRLHSSQNSESAIDSKNKELLIAEYVFYPKSVNVNGKTFIIKEIWAEKEWVYKDPKEHKSWIYKKTKTEDLIIEESNEKQLVFVFNEKIRMDRLGVSKDSLQKLEWCNACGYHTDNLIINIEEEEISKDTLLLYLFEDNHLEEEDKPNKFITELKLVKKHK